MKLFIKKTIYFSFLVLILPLILILSIEFQFKEIDISNIYGKYLKLTKDKNIIPLDILVAGDSRAERQIIPEILKTKSKTNILNLAISSGDIVRLKDFFTNRPEAKSLYNYNTTLLISASPKWINDNLQKWGYLSYSTFKYLNFFEKIDILKDKKDYFKYVLSIHKHNFRNILNFYENKSLIDDLGYVSISGDLTSIKKNNLKSMILSQKNEFLDIESNGYRWREFKNSLEFLSTEFGRVIIIIPPVSGIWMNSIKNTPIEVFNKNYVNKLKSLTEDNKMPNTFIWNFYNDENIKLNDNDFYDTHHLNKFGAEKFSRILAKKLCE